MLVESDTIVGRRVVYPVTVRETKRIADTGVPRDVRSGYMLSRQTSTIQRQGSAKWSDSWSDKASMFEL